MVARSQQLAEVGMREEIVLGPVQGINFQSVRPANQKICIWDIPLLRQLEMAVQEAPLPDIMVGDGVQGRGAWMAFIWDARESLVQEQVSFMFLCRLRETIYVQGYCGCMFCTHHHRCRCRISPHHARCKMVGISGHATPPVSAGAPASSPRMFVQMQPSAPMISRRSSQRTSGTVRTRDCCHVWRS